MTLWPISSLQIRAHNILDEMQHKTDQDWRRRGQHSVAEPLVRILLSHVFTTRLTLPLPQYAILPYATGQYLSRQLLLKFSFLHVEVRIFC
jgi:hypothetical protein